MNLSQLGNKHGRTGMGLPQESIDRLEKIAGVVKETEDISTHENEPKKPEPAKAPDPVVKEPATPPAKTEPAKQDSKSDYEKGGIKAVREAAERRDARIKELEASETATRKEIDDAKASHQASLEKLISYESEIEKTYKPQVQRLTEVEKRLQEREEQLRIKDFTMAPEWHDKYVKPVVEARSEAEALMGELEVNSTDGPRMATKQDFDAVLSAPNTTQAILKAKELFGDDLAHTVVGYRTKIISAERNRQSAFGKAALESAESQKQQQQKFAQHRESLRQRFTAESERLFGEAPYIYKPGEDEGDLAEALTEGTKLADLSINGDPNMTEDQFLKVVAKVRSRAAGFPVLEKRMSKLQAENEALKQRLKEFESSEPKLEGRTTPGAGDNANADDYHGKLITAAQKYASKV